MTTEPPRSPSRVRRSTARVWSTAIYVIGLMLEAVGGSSVPGASDARAATGFGSLIFVIGIVLWISVFFRERRPWAVVIAGGVLALIGSSYLLLLIGAHRVMVRASRRDALLLGAAATAAVGLFVLREAVTRWGDGMGDIFEGLDPMVLSLFCATASLGALFALTAIARAGRARETERRRADHQQSRAAQLDDELARRTERERIARDIHDALAHRLSVISLQGGVVEMAVSSGDAQAVDVARSLRDEAHHALDDLRGLLGELRAEPGRDDAAPRPSMRGISELVRSARAAGATVDAMIMVESVEQAPAVLDSTVHRIVQESLTNALKHATGSPVSAYVEASPTRGVRVRVTNPLRGAAAVSSHGSGAGVVGIRERAELLGGTAWIGEHEGEYVVDVSFPWVQVSAAPDDGPR